MGKAYPLRDFPYRFLPPRPNRTGPRLLPPSPHEATLKDMPASFGLNNEGGKYADYAAEMLQSMSIPPYKDVEDPGVR